MHAGNSCPELDSVCVCLLATDEDNDYGYIGQLQDLIFCFNIWFHLKVFIYCTFFLTKFAFNVSLNFLPQCFKFYFRTYMTYTAEFHTSSVILQHLYR